MILPHVSGYHDWLNWQKLHDEDEPEDDQNAGKGDADTLLSNDSVDVDLILQWLLGREVAVKKTLEVCCD